MRSAALEYLGGFYSYTTASSGTVSLSKIPEVAIVILSGAVYRSGTPGLSTSDATLELLGHYPSSNVNGYSYSYAYKMTNIINNPVTFSISNSSAIPSIIVIGVG